MTGYRKLRGMSGARRRAGVVCLAAVFGLSAPTAALAAKGSPTATAASSAPTATAASSTAAVTPTAPSGSNPLSGGVNPVSPVPTTTTTTPTAVNTNATATAGGSGVSTASALAIVVGAVVLIGGISLYIWRDARRRAPVRTAAAAGPQARVPGSKRPPKARKLSAAERKRRKRGRARR